MRFILVGLLAAASLAEAGTITSTVVNSPGWTNTGGPSFTTAFSWSMSAAYTNVTIEAYLAATPAPVSGLAFLSTQVGPQTTPGDVVGAPQGFQVTSELPAFQWVTLFSGLTLGPGTYFVTLSSPQTSLLLAIGNSSTTTFTNAAGVTRLLDYFANNQNGSSVNTNFGPASTFLNTVNAGPNGDFYSYRVNGDLAGDAAVPEPGSIAMVAFGLMAAVWAQRASRLVLARIR